MHMRKEESAAGHVIVAVILVIVLITAGIFAWTFLARGDDYANDPSDPPEDATEPDPAWQGRFMFSVQVDLTTGNVVGSVDIYQAFMKPLETYDGEPYTLSMDPGSWFKKPESELVKYELTVSKGRTTYTDGGEFHAYESEDYAKVGQESGWFFFWESQAGYWDFVLKCTSGGKTDTATGQFVVGG